MEIEENWLDGEWREDEFKIPAGSPDRTMRRFVLRQDGTDRRYVFEGSSLERKRHREMQAQELQELSSRGCLGILPWLKTKDGRLGVETDGLYWQCRAFSDGEELNRETYGQDGWRGEALAEFLLGLKRCSGGVGAFSPVFRLHDYVHGLMPRLGKRNPALLQDLTPIVSQLHPVLEAEEAMRICYCHGDFHPLNVLWGKNCINAVIDWEFSGLKPILYDIANMVGCLGMDNPEFLTGALVKAFLGRLLANGFVSADEMRLLPEYIVALRFGWMREWCWRAEKDMIIQELDYMWLILDNRELLQKRFLDNDGRI